MFNKFRNERMDMLIQAILDLKTPDECLAFFEDLCTVAELKSMEQRFTVACMLVDGTPYDEIVRTTGASTATISRVNRVIMYGSEGYNRAIRKLKDQ